MSCTVSRVQALSRAGTSGAKVSQAPGAASFAGLRHLSAADALSARPRTALLSAHKPAAQRHAARAARTPTVAAAGGGAAVEPKKVLMLGGTRFIGVYLARQLIEAGHEVTLLTRGKKPIDARIPDDDDASYERFKSNIKHIAADRSDHAALKAAISGKGFQVVYDINGREAEEVVPILEAIPDLQQYIFCSSAGVYKKSDQMPHMEIDEVDFNSRHKGKLYTEDLLEKRGVNWTSIRPVYIYGPLNYNPIEEHIWHRLAAGRPVPVPGSGMQVTQLGHVKDLATAFVAVLGNPKASRQVYNISGERYVTFDGLVKACAQVMGVADPQLVHYNPKEYDFGKAKAFPLRDQHFFTDVTKAMEDLDWAPEFGLLEGLADSYAKDFGRGTFRKPADFTADDMIFEKLGIKAGKQLAAV